MYKIFNSRVIFYCFFYVDFFKVLCYNDSVLIKKCFIERKAKWFSLNDRGVSYGRKEIDI